MEGVLTIGYFQRMTVSGKRAEAARSANAIYERLMKLRRTEDMSNNEWAKRAGVNTSFFTNLRKGSDPSIGNLRAVLAVAGVSLPEFFLDEASGRLILPPDVSALGGALADAISSMPRRADRRASYLAEILSGILALPQTEHATQSMMTSDDQAARAEETEARTATMRA